MAPGVALLLPGACWFGRRNLCLPAFDYRRSKPRARTGTWRPPIALVLVRSSFFFLFRLWFARYDTLLFYE